MKNSRPIVIVGAGPTGIGAAQRLDELDAHWLMLEKEGYVGGLSASFVENDYVWDIGGHVIFSHYDAYDDFLFEAVPPTDWIHHARSAQILVGDTWVPYPFQSNLDALPEVQRRLCHEGLEQVHNLANDRSSFGSYIETHFGAGIATLFMRPYNEKIWAHPLEAMSVDWIRERVARAQSQSEGTDWGPNNRFRFPAHGGTGTIWRNAVRRLPGERIQLGTEVARIDAERRELVTAQGETIAYCALISTMPIDRLARTAGLTGVAEHIPPLSFTSVHVVGLGISGAVPEAIEKYCWMYFPEPGFPFYRATIFSKYSPNNAPPGHWSLMLEVSESSQRKVRQQDLIDRCIEACIQAQLIRHRRDVVNCWHYRTEYGYPIPTLGRDRALDALHRALEPMAIFSRGRFGAWKYEIGNMDHCYMQGREAVDRIVLGTEEMIVHDPEPMHRPGSHS